MWVDILLFLGNNPTYKTASEIVELRNLKANLVSVNVDRLVQDGYLIRKPSAEDRRKTELFCTDKAWPVIERGRELQRAFFDMLFADTDENTRMTDATGTKQALTAVRLRIQRLQTTLSLHNLRRLLAVTHSKTRRVMKR